MYNQKMWKNYNKIKNKLNEIGELSNLSKFYEIEHNSKKLIRELQSLIDKQRVMINIGVNRKTYEEYM